MTVKTYEPFAVDEAPEGWPSEYVALADYQALQRTMDESEKDQAIRSAARLLTEVLESGRPHKRIADETLWAQAAREWLQQYALCGCSEPIWKEHDSAIYCTRCGWYRPKFSAGAQFDG